MVRFDRRRIVKQALALLGSAALGASALAQDKPVTLMVPYPPGGTSDVIARALSPSLARHLGRTVIVENLGGVGGALAAQKVLNAPADGSYIFIGSPNELVLSPLANSAVKYKSENFSAVLMMADMEFAIYGRGNMPASNIDEVLALADKAAKAGKPMTYGSVGHGTIYHLLGEQLSQQTGIPLTHVPYKGGGPMISDLIGGQIDLFVGGYAKSTLELASQGRLKFFTSMTEKPVEVLRNVPTVQESKSLKNFIYTLSLGFFVKKETPPAVTQALHKALSASLTDPAIRANLESQNLVMRKPQSLDEAGKAYAEDTAKFRGIAKSIKLQPQ